MADNTLQAQRRDTSGKGVARKLRAVGRVPAVLYGHGDKTQVLSVAAHDLDLLLHHVNFENTIIGLEIEGAKTDVLIREVQRHPYRPEFHHVDFLQVHGDELLKLDIPVRLVGTPTGVIDEGGVLDHVLYDLHIECLPRHIPEAAEVDISELKIGDSVRVSDLTLPNVSILNDPEQAIATVLSPRVHEEEAGAEDAAPAEPEVLRSKATEE
jgi:large subunit ribosomal protein L25